MNHLGLKTKSDVRALFDKGKLLPTLYRGVGLKTCNELRALIGKPLLRRSQEQPTSLDAIYRKAMREWHGGGIDLRTFVRSRMFEAVEARLEKYITLTRTE
jgi:hypothetical protein